MPDSARRHDLSLFRHRPGAGTLELRLHRLAAATLLGLSLAACGGGGDGAAPTADTGSPTGGTTATPDSVTPGNGQGSGGNPGPTIDHGDDTPAGESGSNPITNASLGPAEALTSFARARALSLSFDGPVDAASITPSSLLLRRGTTDIPYTHSVAGGVVTIQPSARLWPLTTYTLTATPAITGVGGGHLSSALSTHFTTADGQWDSAAMSPEGAAASGAASKPVYSVDAAGNVVAAWIGDGRVQVARLAANTDTWSAARTLSTTGEGSVSKLAISSNERGDALVVWTAMDSDTETFDVASEVHLRAARVSADGQWGPTHWVDRMEDQVNSMLHAPSVALNDAGEALVVYYAQGKGAGQPWSVWASTFDGSAWQTRRVDTVGGDINENRPFAYADATGRLIGVWASGIETNAQLEAAHFEPGASTPPQVNTISALDSGVPIEMVVTPAPDGSATLILRGAVNQNPGPDLYFARLGANLDFSDGPTPLASATDGIRAFDAARAPDGSTLIAANLTGAEEGVWVWRLAATDTTGAAPTQVSAPGSVFNVPRIAVDPAGNALLTYNEFDSTSNRYGIRWARWVAGAGWSPSPSWVSRAPADGGEIHDDNSQLGFDRQGTAFQLWTDAEGAGRIIAGKRFQ